MGRGFIRPRLKRRESPELGLPPVQCEAPALPPDEGRDVAERIAASLRAAAGRSVVLSTVLNPAVGPLAVAETELLLRSVRLLGGSRRDMPVRVLVVGGPTPEISARMQALGAEVLAAEAFDERCPTANKLAALQDIGDADYLLLVDNDVVITGDPTPFLVGDSLALKPECVDHLGLPRWGALFGHLGLTLPSARIVTTIDGQETIGYYNSGVLLVPRALITPLRDCWARAIPEVLEVCDREPAINEFRGLTDQLALAVILARDGLPHRALAPAMHFHTRWPLHPMWQADGCRPVVLHYHHALRPDCAGLTASAHPGANEAIDRLHRALGLV
jgi:hypothetical protein